MICLVCEHETGDWCTRCPNCGYKFTADEDIYCPNSHMSKCQLTGKLCNKGIYWQCCEVKIEAENGELEYD